VRLATYNIIKSPGSGRIGDAPKAIEGPERVTRLYLGSYTTTPSPSPSLTLPLSLSLSTSDLLTPFIPLCLPSPFSCGFAANVSSFCLDFRSATYAIHIGNVLLLSSLTSLSFYLPSLPLSFRQYFIFYDYFQLPTYSTRETSSYFLRENGIYCPFYYLFIMCNLLLCALPSLSPLIIQFSSCK
jgi:hypothetical protein